MKPQQLFTPSDELQRQLRDHVQCARTSLPTLAAIAVALASSVVLMLSGCASSAGIVPTAQPLAPLSVGIDATAAAAPALAPDWWHGFHDARLNELIERALAGNPTLKVAQARLARAQAAVAGAQAAEGPQLNGGVDVTRQRFSATSIYPPPLGGSTRTLANAEAMRDAQGPK